MTLREHRIRKQLTLQQVANRLEIDVGTLSRIERGLQVPGIKTAKKLSDHYSISLDVVYQEQCSVPTEAA